MLSLALGVITTTYLIELQDLRNKILGFFLSFAPSLYVAGTCIVKVLPDLLQSRGSKYLKEVKKFDKTGRPDFSQRTGFMGEVKKEIEYLFDFLRLTHYSDDKMKKRRLIHLAVFIDDLDRCDKSTVMKVLQASILLLVDAPITCWMAIDTRCVVTSTNDHFGVGFQNVGIDGYRYLEKIIQLPFCLPDLSTEAKKNYMLKMLEGQELTSLRVYKRLNFILGGPDREKFLNVFSSETVSRVLSSNAAKVQTEDQAIQALIPVLNEMHAKDIF